MVLTRAQTQSTASAASATNTGSSGDVASGISDTTNSHQDSSEWSPEPSPEVLEEGLGPWPRSDARTASRTLRDKLTKLGLERKKESDMLKQSAPPFAMTSFSHAITADFNFAKTLDNTDGLGSAGVVVDSYSYAPIGGGSLFRAWQLQRQHATQSIAADPARATETATMGLFALLPAELRNDIYRLALVMPRMIIPLPFDVVMQRETCTMGPCTHSRLPTAVPGLLSTCEQIRAEAMPIFVAENVAFRFDARVVEARCTAHWIRAIGWYARLIKKVEFVFTVFESYGRVRDHEIVLTCPQGHVLAQGEGVGGEGVTQVGLFDVKIDEDVQEKSIIACEKLKKRVQEWNDRLSMGSEVRTEEALWEFVGSDCVSDVVWRCKKG